MLSVLIETRNDEEGLARTLASLVGGAVEGIVREVIVCDGGSTDQTRRVADHAGCHLVTEGGMGAAIGQAKGEWLLVLEPGSRLVDGWTETVILHVTKITGPARFSRSRDERQPLLTRIFSRRRALSDGLLIRKVQAVPLRAASAEALARCVARQRLPAQIRVAIMPPHVAR